MMAELTIKRIESYVQNNNRLGLVRVVTESGASGWGQMAPTNADISQMVLHRQVTSLVLGQDALDRDSISQHVIETSYKFPGTYICRALAGIDTALWDLYGKLEGQPVARLIGARELIAPAYASSTSRIIEPRDEAARMVLCREQNGFEAFKVRVGKRMGHDVDERPGRTEEIIPLIRQALGPDVRLMVDANSGFSVGRAIQVGHMLEDQGYAHYEEPCPYWDIEALATVAETLDIAVAAGEQDYDLMQWRRILTTGAVDIAQPDICYVGGMTRALTVARMAAEYNRPIVPHASNNSLVQVFSAHLLAGIPNAGPHFEFSIEPHNVGGSIYEPLLEVHDGVCALSDTPGWGVTIKQTWLDEAHREVSELEA